MAKVNVNNVPVYALKAPYWVCRQSEDGLWFWGAWDNENEAHRVAKEIGGVVIDNE